MSSAFAARTGPWLRRHGPRLTVLAALLVLAWMYMPVFRGEPSGDDNTFHLAESARIAECLRSGDWDFWNPSANAGYATAYYYQVIPQAVPAILATITGGHLLFWFQLCIFVPLVLVPWFGDRGLRLLGAEPWAAACGGIAIAFCVSNNRWGHGADGQFSIGLYTQTWAFAIFPLALGHAVRWIRDRSGLAWAVATATFIGLCHPFAGIALGVALAASVMLQPAHGLLRKVSRALGNAHLPPLVLDGRGWAGELGRMVMLGALLIVASMAGWLTVIVDYVGFGGFPHRVADEVGPGVIALGAEMGRGHLFDYGRPGVLTVLLVVGAVVVRGRHQRWLLGGVIAYVALLCIGPHLVTKDDLLPAVRFLGTLQILSAMLAGAGAVILGDRLWRWGETSARRNLVRNLVVTVGTAAVALVIVPTACYQHTHCATLRDRPQYHRDELMHLITVMRGLPDGRKQSLTGTESHWWTLLPYVYGGREALIQMGGGGLQASPNYVYLWGMTSAVRRAQIYDAPYGVFLRSDAKNQPMGITLATTTNYELRQFEANGLLVPAEIVGVLPVGRAAGREAALAWLKSDAAIHDQFRAYPPFEAAAHPAGPPHGRTISVRRRPSPGDASDIVAVVQADAPTTFVLRESWHPRWHAFVDGQPADVLRVTPDFSAVDVPPGIHAVTFRFDRPWWAHAAWGAWPLTVALGVLLERLLRRRALAPPR